MDGCRPAGELEFAAGRYYIQDTGSLLAVSALDPQPGEWILDLCAAPGGKSTAILDRLGDSGWLLANEVIQSRQAALQLNLARSGNVRYGVSQRDPERLADQLGPIFDSVLVDAPCSGQSLFARGKQDASAFASKAVEYCAAREARILRAASQLVRPGGRLVYSTCTFAFTENEQQVDQFLSQHKDWTTGRSCLLESWRTPGFEGCYRLWPHREPTSGAFAAVLQRADGAERDPSNVGRGPPSSRTGRRIRRRGLPDSFEDWGQLTNVDVRGSELRLFGWPGVIPRELEPACSVGPEIAFRKRVAWFPSYALAMRRDPHWQPHRYVELNDDQARAYVAGDTFEQLERGWSVATWRGGPLGWFKSDGRRAKNHLPRAARLTPNRH